MSADFSELTAALAKPPSEDKVHRIREELASPDAAKLLDPIELRYQLAETLSALGLTTRRSQRCARCWTPAGIRSQTHAAISP